MKKILFILPLLFAVSTQAEKTEVLTPSIEGAFTVSSADRPLRRGLSHGRSGARHAVVSRACVGW